MVQYYVRLRVQINNMVSISVSQLRSNIKKHLDFVASSEDIIVVSRSKKEEAVIIMSLNEYNSITETAHLLSSIKNRARLQESINQLRENKTFSFDPTIVE